MRIAQKEDKENEEGNVKKIRHKKIEKIQRQKNRARWNEIESETEEIRSKKKIFLKQWVAQEESWCSHHRTH